MFFGTCFTTTCNFLFRQDVLLELSRELQALGRQDKSTVLLQNSTITRTRIPSSRLQISFRQSTFGVFLLGMRPISRTGHQRSLKNIFGIQLPKERKGLYLYSIKSNFKPNPSSFFGLECFQR
jgi:hypothetical protein